MLYAVVPADLFPVFFCYKEHPETFSFFLSGMFMMHLVCPPYSSYIPVITFAEQAEALVDDHFMYYKICQPVKSDAKANSSYPIPLMLQTKHDAQPARHSKDEKECIVLFDLPPVRFMVVFMQEP